MFRFRSNWRTMLVKPPVLVELIELRPEIDENAFSSGSATVDATVSGLAPGRAADTWTVGKSTVGRSLNGRSRYAIAPKTMMPSITNVVVIGRSMEKEEMFIIRRFHD